MLSVLSSLLNYVGILISISFPQHQRPVNTNRLTDYHIIAGSVKNFGYVVPCSVSAKPFLHVLKTRSKKNRITPPSQKHNYNGKKQPSNVPGNRTAGFPDSIKMWQMLMQNEPVPFRNFYPRMQRGDASASNDPLPCSRG